MRNDTLKEAVAVALSGEWDKSHRIVQQLNDPISCWIHAVLHKIEGDEWNSRYWYARTRAEYEDYSDPTAELGVIGNLLDE